MRKWIWFALVYSIPGYGAENPFKLEDANFQEIFMTEIRVEGKLDNEFRYVISKEGVLCPMRSPEKNGKYSFFDLNYENSGCIDTRAFKNHSELASKFESHAPEKLGKRFELHAKRVGSASSSVTLELILYGKTQAGGLVRVWVESRTNTKLRLTRKRDRWMAEFSDGSDWKVFNRIVSEFKKPGWLGAGLSAIFSSEGSISRPFQVQSHRVEYR